MSKIRKSGLIAVPLAVLSAAWKYAQWAFDVVSTPDNATKLWGAIVNAPQWIPWVILIASLLALVWSVRPSRSPIVPRPEGSTVAPDDEFTRTFDEIVSDWMPFVALRKMAGEYGIDVLGIPGSNTAYALEGALRQAAVDGDLAVKGRKHRRHDGDNEPLVAIPASHFEEYGFAHGTLDYPEPNDRSKTGTMDLAVRGIGKVEGVTYYDLHLSTSGARNVLRNFKVPQ